MKIIFYADMQQTAIELFLQFQHFYSIIQHYYNKFGPNFIAKFDKQMYIREIKTLIAFHLYETGQFAFNELFKQSGLGEQPF